MKCPNDAATLLMAERRGVEIDYCPECRGVWLDRGELDKLLEIAEVEGGGSAAAPASAAPAPPAGAPQLDQPVRPHQPPPSREEPKKKKRTSFLSELLEFGGE